MKDLIAKIRALAKDGLFHIFGSSVLAQVGGLISSMIVVRKLPKVDYGYYVSANNLYSYLAIFIGLGLTSAVIQYCSERITEQRRNAIYRHSMIAGSMSNMVVFATIMVLAFFKEMSGDPQVAYYLRLMSGLPFVVYAYSYFQVILRVKLKNRAFSYANMLYSGVMLAGNIVFTLLIGIPGLILSIYLANLVAAAKCAVELQKDDFFGQIVRKENWISSKDKREINGYALICALTNFASTLLVLLDVTCLDLVIGNSEVLADYKVAATIPSACTFIPSCLMTFFYPKLVDAFSVSRDIGRVKVKWLMKAFLMINGAVYMCLALGAPLIIWIIFGEKYLNVVPIFEVLSLNYFIYCQRHLLGNVIAVIKRVKVNLVFSIISGLLNIVLNLILIQWFASIGAALATVLVTCSMLVMDYAYLQHYYKRV